MERWYGLNDVVRGEPAVAIGVFDGVHRGHRVLLRRARADARARGERCVALTFDPNPAEVVQPQPPTRLSTLAQRLDLLEWIGVDVALVLPFDAEVAAMEPEDFIDQILVGALGTRLVVVGENFRFGSRARGDVAMLRQLGGSAGVEVDAVPLLQQRLVGRGDKPLSSTEICACVAAGDVAAAGRGLARPHRVEGRVVRGAQRGRDLGFPTANVFPTPLAAVPAEAVYAGRLVVSPYGDVEQSFPAAISVGSNPTFQGDQLTVEAYAIDAPADLDLYDRMVAVDFVGRLRRQQKFTSAEKLVAQMTRDVELARDYLGLR
ncbi:MAG: bifunctional riboflavin kinase/FAD synthetase [Actinobacteria bacterium]|nr:MAG: bifunctional riboflavin kinase/FAD synthetase [Actinomycetota bacterium]